VRSKKKGPTGTWTPQPALIQERRKNKEAVVDSISFMSVLSLAMTAFGLGLAIGIALRER